MKKLDDFYAEETGEDWLRELYKVITMRRSSMFRLIAVSVQQAHSAEAGLRRFVDGETNRSQVMFTVEDATFRLADFATLSGIISAGTFLLAGLSSIVLLVLFC